MTENEKTQPNLFDFATGELSQDAFIAWLLSWADPAYAKNALHECAMQVLKAMFAAGSITLPEQITSVKAIAQYRNIDVLIEVNCCYRMIVEDKTSTSHHSGQLVRYRDLMLGKEILVRRKKYIEAEKATDADKLAAIYFKMEEQGNYDALDAAGYGRFSRKKLLPILQGAISEGCANDILVDFTRRLQYLNDRIEAYRTQPIPEPNKKWSRYAWQGFFVELQAELGTGGWRKVANPAGGFMGFYWGWHTSGGCEQYLQLEDEKLCLKIKVEEASDRKSQLQFWSQRLVNHIHENGFTCSKPKRLSSGKFMTVATVDDYRKRDANGFIDIAETVRFLRDAETFLNSAASGV